MKPVDDKAVQPADGDGKSITGFTDAELSTLCAALALYRDARMHERPEEAPDLLLYQGDALPKGIDGEILRATGLLHRLKVESLKRGSE